MFKKIKYFDFLDFISIFKFCLSREINKFEKDFAKYIGTKFAIGTSFGRTALYLGLRAAELKGQDVIIPAFTCSVVRHAVIMAGAKPIFVDINPDTFEYNFDALKKSITTDTKAIILTHYFGRVSRDIDKIIQIAKLNKLLLIEDCAHSLGGEYRARKIGTYGTFSIFSLTKNMINFGGGVLVTDDDTIYQNARTILNKEKLSLKKRIFDFPLILSYGLEQIINKLIFDRPKKSIYKWWLIHLPKYMFLNTRRYLIHLIKFPISITKSNIKHVQDNKAADNNPIIGVQHYKQDIGMPPVIATLSRTQLRKTNAITDKKKKIFRRFVNLHCCDSKLLDEPEFKDVFSFLVLRFPNHNIYQLIEKSKKCSLQLKGTWPTHQKIWEQQDTVNLRKIEKDILTWNITPNVYEKEINTLINFLSEYS